MNLADTRRRHRRIFLLLSAILIPTAIVIVLVVHMVRQEAELSDRRMAEERREALAQFRRELSAQLQAIKLEEVNRLIGESGARLPPDSPIVFVAPVRQDRLILPWEENLAPTPPSADFRRHELEGEAREFQDNDAAGAASAYRHALEIAHTSAEKCEAQLWIGRAYLKAGLTREASSADHNLLQECGAVPDGEGIPFGLYAAQRLLVNGGNDAAAQNYVIARAKAGQLSAPNEAYMLRALLNMIPNAAAGESGHKLSLEIRDMEQIMALSQDIHDHQGKLQGAFRSAPGDLSWMGYGAEPWLITMVSPSSFAAPVLMAVSTRKLVPGGATLRVEHTPNATPLGDGFVDLEVEWPATRFSQHGVPGFLYASTLFLVLGAALLAIFLLLRDVHREVRTAELRSHFVASVTHELKTPLTSIRGFGETLLLGRADGTPAATEYLRTIVSESERLSRLVENVLDLSRIEQGRKIYRMDATCLTKVVRSAARAMEYPFSQLGFTLTLSTDGTEPTLHADADALEQAILNLIDNALKYSGDARRVEMRAGSQGNHAFVDVVDHGIGISREDQARIFEKFHRVRSAETEGITGTGLGLALALHIVEAHKGRIEVSSDAGRGSTFSVRIPLQTQS